jgi:TorA maturation chaperone TorD
MIMSTATAPAIAEEDRLRADLYNFMGLLLAGPPDEMLLAQTAGLSGDDSDLGQAVTTLAKMARISKPKAVESEFNKLFIGLGRGELLPYASYYLTGFLNEKPLAQLRQDMTARGLARAENVFEPEDNIASLMEMMGAMIVGRFGTPADLATQKEFFNRHIAPWAAHFFGDLEGAKNSVFYTPVGTVGRTFMEIEAEAFRLS